LPRDLIISGGDLAGSKRVSGCENNNARPARRRPG
jgi:hypothetical protein